MIYNLQTWFKDGIKNLLPDSILTHRLPRQAGNAVMLTFDDGPDPIITPIILDLLSQYHASAIFFIVGKKAKKHPEIINQIIARGHIIGNHTYNHPNRIISSVQEYRQEILLCAEILNVLNINTLQLVRPPLGLSLANLLVSISMRLKIVLWSIEGGEWGVNKNDKTEDIIYRLQNSIQSRDILLLHDDNERVISILNGILPFLIHRKFNLNNGIKFLI